MMAWSAGSWSADAKSANRKHLSNSVEMSCEIQNALGYLLSTISAFLDSSSITLTASRSPYTSLNLG
jgi:hypothetical protein